MALPKVEIKFDNGALGTVVPLKDGMAGLVASASVVIGKFELNKAYFIKGTRDLVALGIDATTNAKMYKAITEFYAEAGEGAELWLMGVSHDLLMSEWFEKDANGVAPVHTLLNAAKGEIRILFTAYDPPTPYVTIVPVAGFDPDLAVAIPLANEIAVDFTNLKYAPFIVLMEGYAYDGSLTPDLMDLTTMQAERVAVVVGDTAPSGTNQANRSQATGVFAGRLAKNRVHRNVGRVADGSLKPTTAYITDVPAEQFDIEMLNDNGYLTFRVHTGKSGYYAVDDPMATEKESDYYAITNRRVIDKAFRIAYDTLVEYLLDSVPTAGGKIKESWCKAVESDVVTAISGQMTANGELATDDTNPNDYGVVCVIDPNQDVLATSTINVEIRVRPYGYARYISVLIGFMK